jgi:transcriptional regulator with XRE-family HTH domain
MENDFAVRLKTIREQLNWTQSELGAKAGLPTSSIAQFETNARKPSFDTLRRLAMALEVTTDYLLGRVDEPTTVKTGGTLFRHYDQMSGDDRKLLEDFAAILAARNPKNEPKI